NIEEYDNTAARIFSDLSIPFSHTILDGYTTIATTAPINRVIGANGTVASALSASTTEKIFPFDDQNDGLFYYANAKLYTEADISNYFAATYGNGIKSDYIEALTSGKTVQ
ncbi:MAG: hypothetical protein VX737_01140, partial [Pseudomonadota bacterium]|nr:hypothetical protein [Pseudomonadota bacterium]